MIDVILWAIDVFGRFIRIAHDSSTKSYHFARKIVNGKHDTSAEKISPAPIFVGFS